MNGNNKNRDQYLLEINFSRRGRLDYLFTLVFQKLVSLIEYLLDVYMRNMQTFFSAV
jgi:hypothetical protein